MGESTTSAAVRNVPDFLRGGGEMGAMIRAFDWSKTPVGPVHQWPQSLQTALSILLGSGYPMFIAWGPEFIQFYNDGYRPILGSTKHPAALGQPTPECFHEIWDFIGPMFHRAREEGEATTLVDQLLPLDRNGYVEECYFTFSYSAIREQSGQGGGVLVTVIETTARVLGERRLRTLRDLAARSIEAKDSQSACAAAAQTLASNPHDVACSAIYLFDKGRSSAILAGFSGPAPEARIKPGNPEIQQILAGDLAFTIPYGGLACGVWPEPVQLAEVVAIPVPGHAEPAGFLRLGISPRKAFDEEYASFFQKVAGHIGSAIAEAEAFEAERKRAEMLAELDRAKTVFFSNVSHEFRTPLTLLLGPVEEILARPGDTLSCGREELDVVHRNALRLLRLVNSLLDFSRIGAGRIRAHYEPTDLAVFTTDLAGMFRSAMEKAGLEFTVDCPPLPEPLYVDRPMWENIVLNLLSNAYKFTLEGGVRVSLGTGNGAAILRVADTGTGIPEDELPRLFERFHRVEGARGRSFEGTGIGLALVNELVHLHGGNIDVESAVDRGTTFSVAIPFGRDHLPAEKVAETAGAATVTPRAIADGNLLSLPDSSLPAAASPNQSSGRILLADDNPDMRDYVSRILQASYEVHAVANGHEALKAATEAPPDLLISDVMMPGMDGFELLRQMRANPASATVPVILLSARAGDDSRVEGLDAGADDYLVKPFTASELLARVRSHIGMARRREAADHVLRESEQRFRLLADAAPVLIWQSDRQGRRDYFNRPWIEFTGRSLESELGDGWLSGVHPDDRQRLVEVFHHALEVREPFRIEYRLIRHDGQYRWILDHGVPRFTGSGELAGFIGSCVDITERKVMEDSLRAANRDLEQFAYAASHDLQEPLRNISNYSQLLVRRYQQVQDDDVQSFVDCIVDGAKRMQALLRDLLSFTNISRARESPAALIDAEEVLGEVIDSLEMAIEESGGVVGHDALPKLRVERVHLLELLQNLISNALKYRGEEPPQVHVGAERTGGEWIFCVFDNGIGIDPRYAKTIFGLFKRLHGRDKYPGTGLGLAICSKVVERYGGRIWVESQPGEGSRFYFTLPAA